MAVRGPWQGIVAPMDLLDPPSNDHIRRLAEMLGHPVVHVIG
jgi:hypothetical protein